MASPDDLLTTAEVAVEARVSTPTVLRWARDGVLPAVKVGKVLRFRRADVDILLTPKVAS